MKKSNKKGITLIALIITIIVLLILAGITISLTIGERGIVNRAQEAGIKSEEASAREKLELALIDLQADKVTNPEYNENEYIDNYLSNEQMAITGDIVLVDGWQFQIDRSVPKVIASLGKGQESQEINLTAIVENVADFTKAKIKVEVAYEGEITSIQINGPRLTIPQKVDGKYILEQEVTQNGNYTVYVKDANDSYKIANVKVTEISEDMVIRTPEELVAFRDRVNKGATYAGRTITLANDLNLSTVCGETVGSWTPIGDYGAKTSLSFNGTFEGNNHTIDNLYINTALNYQGLFGCNKGNIYNLSLGYGIISVAGTHPGGIVGYNAGTVSKCKNSTTISSTAQSIFGGGIVGSNKGTVIQCINTGNITGYHILGGIIGVIQGGTVTQCINTGTIKAQYYNSTYVGQAGGIVGVLGSGKCTIDSCYNLGTVTVNSTSSHGAGGIVGTAFTAISSGSIVKNCYNVGTTSIAKYKGGIIGNNGGNVSFNKTNNYWLTGIGASYGIGYSNSNSGCTPVNASTLQGYATTLGAAYTNDIQNKDGTWKYNNGYPILKWQTENN